MVFERREGESQAPAPVPLLSPDGAATNEMYLAAQWRARVQPSAEGQPTEVGAPEATETAGTVATRIGHVITGLTVVGLSDCGAVACGAGTHRVWVVGRAAGAADYVASLSSGLRGAQDVAGSLCRETDQAAVVDDSERGGGS